MISTLTVSSTRSIDRGDYVSISGTGPTELVRVLATQNRTLTVRSVAALIEWYPRLFEDFVLFPLQDCWRWIRAKL